VEYTRQASSSFSITVTIRDYHRRYADGTYLEILQIDEALIFATSDRVVDDFPEALVLGQRERFEVGVLGNGLHLANVFDFHNRPGSVLI
jgi:hypothetical protein